MDTFNDWGNADNSSIIFDGFQRSLAEVAQVTAGPSGYGFKLPKDACIGMRTSVNAKDRLTVSGIPIYGVTAGFGDSGGRQIGLEKTVAMRRNLLHLTVSDSDLTAPSAPGGNVYLGLERRIQDPYSIRCAPQVVGVLRDTMAWVQQWLTHEIKSSNDNPLFTVEADVVPNNGNFYGGHVARVAQAPTSAVASVADLLNRQLALLVDEKFNLGLTPNLIARVDPDDPDAGVYHGFKDVQIPASALAAEALHFYVNEGSFSRLTEAHNQDKVRVGVITAIHFLVLCQAADLVGASQLSIAVGRVPRFFRSAFLPVDEDCPLDVETRWIGHLVRNGS